MEGEENWQYCVNCPVALGIDVGQYKYCPSCEETAAANGESDKVIPMDKWVPF